MGAADVVPGASGGTIAFITGIYKTLLDSLKSFDLEALKLLMALEFKSFWNHINGSFLLSVALGILVSLKTLSKVVLLMMKENPIPLWSFFFGLILISGFSVARIIKKRSFTTVVAGVLGAIVAFLICSTYPIEIPSGNLFLFFSAMIAICAMILPGISGSFILLILGKYEEVLTALKELEVVKIMIFALGCGIGLISFSRVISFLLNKYHDITVAILSGFMIGSLYKVWPWRVGEQFRINSHGEQVAFIERNVFPNEYLALTSSSPKLLEAVLFFALGIITIVAIEKLSTRLKA